MSVEVKISVSVVVESTICSNYYLMVVEETPDGVRINQPSGHLEVGETPEEGAIRECKEETGLDFVIEVLKPLLQKYCKKKIDMK